MLFFSSESLFKGVLDDSTTDFLRSIWLRTIVDWLWTLKSLSNPIYSVIPLMFNCFAMSVWILQDGNSEAKLFASYAFCHDKFLRTLSKEKMTVIGWHGLYDFKLNYLLIIKKIFQVKVLQRNFFIIWYYKSMNINCLQISLPYFPFSFWHSFQKQEPTFVEKVTRRFKNSTFPKKLNHMMAFVCLVAYMCFIFWFFYYSMTENIIQRNR